MGELGISVPRTDILGIGFVFYAKYLQMETAFAE